MTVEHSAGRAVIVRPTSRTITPRRHGTGHGYEIDYIDGQPRVTYNPGQLGVDELGYLVHDLATKAAITRT